MIVFIGLAGSGKSTQGQMLAKRLGCPWLSTGQLLRDKITDPKTIQDMMEGEIIPDNVLMPFLEEELKRLQADKNEVILDGSPRTMHQAHWLVGQVKTGKLKLTAVIHLEAEKDLVKKRLLARGRQDDTEAAIEERFKEFDTVTKPIVGYLKNQGFKVYTIDGRRGPKAVEVDIEKALKI